MALENVFDCTPLTNPQTDEEYKHNWNKLKELFDVLNCIFGQVITQAQMLCECYDVHLGDNTFDIPTDWYDDNFPLSSDTCDYLVFWNGQFRQPEGDLDGEYAWSIDTDAATISFTHDFADDCQLCIIYLRKGTLELSLLNCEESTESCI